MTMKNNIFYIKVNEAFMKLKKITKINIPIYLFRKIIF